MDSIINDARRFMEGKKQEDEEVLELLNLMVEQQRLAVMAITIYREKK